MVVVRGRTAMGRGPAWVQLLKWRLARLYTARVTTLNARMDRNGYACGALPIKYGCHVQVATFGALGPTYHELR